MSLIDYEEDEANQNPPDLGCAQAGHESEAIEENL
jgi:hypothetical protein